MSNDSESDIADIIAQLQHLQLQQTNLLEQLARSQIQNTASEPLEREYFDTAAEVPRDFQIGDRVRILNPKRFQANKGTIIRIGESRVTIKPPIGRNIQQSPNNLILDT